MSSSVQTRKRRRMAAAVGVPSLSLVLMATAAPASAATALQSGTTSNAMTSAAVNNGSSWNSSAFELEETSEDGDDMVLAKNHPMSEGTKRIWRKIFRGADCILWRWWNCL